jgi:hypothetical protein
MFYPCPAFHFKYEFILDGRFDKLTLAIYLINVRQMREVHSQPSCELPVLLLLLSAVHFRLDTYL